MEFFDQLSKLLQILFVDLVLAGDNAIVIGLVAAKFSPDYRRKVILYGVAGAILLRVVFALLTVQLLAIKGLALLGGLLLLWICWKLWQELGEVSKQQTSPQNTAEKDYQNPPLPSAVFQILIADLSMSLDNVVAVAGIADGHSVLLVVGLAISILFMMFFANWIANILQKRRWIGYIGLAIIFYVALKLIYNGFIELGATFGF
jgi:YjbE family integral membrane protein